MNGPDPRDNSYRAERNRLRGAARNRLLGHQVLDTEDLTAIMCSSGGQVRTNRINLALLAGFLRSRGWSLERIQRELAESPGRLRELLEEPIIAGEKMAADIEAELVRDHLLPRVMNAARGVAAAQREAYIAAWIPAALRPAS